MEPYTLTKLDLAALKQADYLGVWYFGEENGRTNAQAVKRANKTEKDPFATDAVHVITAPIRVRCYENTGLFAKDNDRISARAAVSFYHGNSDTDPTSASSVVRLLRAGDGIIFEFHADALTTTGLRDAGFHGDRLCLLVWRGKERFRLVLDSCTCPDNTARMVQGVASRD